METPGQHGATWTLLTGHGHVLVEIARDRDARIRDISSAVDLTERTVQAIVADLETAGYLTRTRIGRRTRYTLNADSPFRHGAQQGLRVGPMLELLTAMAQADAPCLATRSQAIRPRRTSHGHELSSQGRAR
jgi:DNA-binding Lrp family transcriptional regulator